MTSAIFIVVENLLRAVDTCRICRTLARCFIVRTQWSTVALPGHLRDAGRVSSSRGRLALVNVFTFEKHVRRTSGGKGFADVWRRDHFAWEYNGKHKDLAAAYKQLNDYREDLGNPPLLVVCDFDRFEVHTNFTSTVKRVYAFNLDDLNRNQVAAACPLPPIDVLRALFGDYNVLRPERTDAQVTQEAAKLFSRLAERLELEERNLGASKCLRQRTKEEHTHGPLQPTAGVARKCA